MTRFEMYLASQCQWPSVESIHWNMPQPFLFSSEIKIGSVNCLFTGGHRTRVAAVTLDNMAKRVFAQRGDLS